MRRWNVLNLYEIDAIPGCLDCLNDIATVTTVTPTRENLARHLPKADAYLAALKVPLTRDLIESAPCLKAVATASTGTDHLDCACLDEKGIPLLSLKHDTEFLDTITSTAEMGWALLLAVVRKLPWSFEAARRGDWARDRFRGRQLSGLTLGIVGYGRLGRIMAEYGKAFRMRVLACDIKDVTPADGVEVVDFSTLLSTSDVLSIHVHLTPETTGLIDADAFAALKPGAVLINTSRGAIVDEAAMLDALESGKLGGAGLDVIHGEWDEALHDHPLVRYARTHDNLVISPHTGGVTFEAQRLVFEFIARKLADFLEGLESE